MAISGGDACHRRLAAATVIVTLTWTTGCSERTSAPPVSLMPPIADVPVGPVPGGVREDRSALGNPVAGDPDALRDGRAFFVAYNCSGCHGDHGGGGMGPSLRDASWIYGGSAAEIANSVVQGRAHGMPAWGTRLTPEQVWQIVAYLGSMRTPREPDPPAGG